MAKGGALHVSEVTQEWLSHKALSAGLVGQIPNDQSYARDPKP